MEEKRLHKSRREGILNNFIEARCSCGPCRCSATCACSGSWDGAAISVNAPSNDYSITTGYFYTVGV